MNSFEKTIFQLYGDQGKKWLASLPLLITSLSKRWQFTVLHPFSQLSYNYVLNVSLADGNTAVLKCGLPNTDISREIAALKYFDGQGSIKLLNADESLGAMLLEAASPGNTLLEIKEDEKATEIFVNVILNLHQPLKEHYSFPTVQTWFESFTQLEETAKGNPFSSTLIDAAQQRGKELIDSMSELVLLHGDLHHLNILSATREPWLAIDPKGVIGEREYEVGAFMRNPMTNLTTTMDTRKIVTRRIEILTDLTGFDRQRIIGWSFYQAVLAAIWCFEDMGTGFESFVQCAEVLKNIN